MILIFPLTINIGGGGVQGGGCEKGGQERGEREEGGRKGGGRKGGEGRKGGMGREKGTPLYPPPYNTCINICNAAAAMHFNRII